MLLVFYHSAEVISEPAADRENGQHLDEIRERRRILERMRRICVRVSAAVRAEHLDRDLRRHRTLHDVLLGDGLFFRHRLVVSSLNRLALVVFLFDLHFHRLRQRRLGVTVEILNHPLRYQKDRKDETNGQEQVVGQAYQIHPEIADGLGRMARDRPDERGRDRNASCGGSEIVKSQPDHLREIRHGGFAAVVLPIGVGSEADCGIEGEVVAHRSESLRIQRQDILQTQNRVSEEATHQTEEQHGEGVLFPIVLFAGIDSHQSICQSFQWTQHRIEPGPAIGIEHLQQIKPHRLGNQHKRDKVEGKLKPAGSFHGSSSKFFRPDHRHEQINEEQQRDDSDNNCFHGVLLQLLAEADIKSADDKKDDNDSNEN